MPALLLSLQIAMEGDSVVANFNMHNDGPGDRTIRLAGTPLEPIAGPTLALRLGDRVITYRGPTAVRDGPGRSVSLKSGEAISQVLRLDDAFDISEPGAYLLSWDLSIVSWAESAIATQPSDAMRERVRGTQGFVVHLPRVSSPFRPVVAKKQSPEGAYDPPRNEAVGLAGKAAVAASKPDHHFKAWFKAMEDPKGVVGSSYSKIAEGLAKVRIVDVSCQHLPADVIAYVTPGTRGPIHLCGRFANTADSEDDATDHTKASVLLHEAGHLFANMGDEGGRDGPLCAWIQPHARAIGDAYAFEYYAAWSPGRKPPGLRAACP